MNDSHDDKIGAQASHEEPCDPRGHQEEPEEPREERTHDERFSLFVSLIARINRAIRQIKDLEMHGIGLRGIHVMILFHLARAGKGLTQAELAQLCYEDKATISRATTTLIEKGIVEAQPVLGRHRNIPLRLTKIGRESTSGLTGAILRAVDAGGAGLTESDRDSCYRVLSLVNENLTAYLAGMRSRS